MPHPLSPRSPVLWVGLTALVLAGCQGDAEPAETVTVTQSESAPPTTATTDTTMPSPSPPATSSASATPSATATASTSPPPSASPTTAATGGPGTYPNAEATLDLTQSSEEGLTVDLTRIAVEGNTLSIDVTAFNATPDFTQLASGGVARSDAISVRLGDGPELLYQPPADNEELQIESREELTGTIGFIGRIPADATVARVEFSHTAVLNNRITPNLIFEEVPLP